MASICAYCPFLGFSYCIVKTEMSRCRLADHVIEMYLNAYRLGRTITFPHPAIYIFVF